jgi:3-phosphoshikimate 1-carboxyvinyltransferase
MGLEATIGWSLPPSKSHMIRWLAIAAQAEGDTELSFTGSAGKDVLSMADCLREIGVAIDQDESRWVISGVGSRGFQTPEGILDCGNSGTAARFLMAIAAGMSGPTSLDGDQSLRQRDMSALTGALRELGCEVTSDTFPLTVTGPVVPGSAYLDVSNSSQPLSALLLASPGYSGAIHLKTSSHSVSRGYSDLSYELATRCGSSNEIVSDSAVIEPWRPVTPDKAKIPGELSLLPLAMLLAELHDVEVVLTGDDLELSGSLMGLAERTEELDLRDESDIIAPAAALMALGNGGRIRGVAHARGKESDRISSTVDLLDCFGMEATETDDGIEVVGGQTLVRPILPVDSQGDHRLAMTAMVLASKCGGSVAGADVCTVSDPDFIKKLMRLED